MGSFSGEMKKNADGEQPKETINQKIEGDVPGVGFIGKVEGDVHIHQGPHR